MNQGQGSNFDQGSTSARLGLELGLVSRPTIRIQGRGKDYDPVQRTNPLSPTAHAFREDSA